MKKHIGSTFDSFLEEEGIKQDVDLLATKKRLAGCILILMDERRVTRTALAKRMNTSRTLVNRILDPSDASITLATLSKASHALDTKLIDLLVSLEPAKTKTRKQRR